MLLEGKVAIITGAGRGIGAATARRFVAEGARVALCSRTATQLEVVVEEINAHGNQALGMTGDVSDEAFVARLFKGAVDRFGRVDVLINNAGVLTVRPFLEIDTQTWDRMLSVNLRATFLCARAAFQAMQHRGGVIVNVAGHVGAGARALPAGQAAYITAKQGVRALTEALAVEGRAFGIRVNAVAPGSVDTQLFRESAPGTKAATSPDQVADTLAWLASDRAGHLNGTIVDMPG